MRTSASSASWRRSCTSPSRVVDAALGRLREDAGDAGVGVLHVVDRVLVALALRQVDVELHLGVGGALEEEEAAGVGADLIDDLAQGDDLAGALREAHGLAAALEADELADDDLKPPFLDAEGLHGRLHARDVALVVGAPDVDREVEAAADELVVVVGDVGGEVGRDAGRADEDVVLVLAEGAAVQPDGAFLVDDGALLAQQLHRLLVDAGPGRGVDSKNQSS